MKNSIPEFPLTCNKKSLPGDQTFEKDKGLLVSGAVL